jgi:hypothetical protein
MNKNLLLLVSILFVNTISAQIFTENFTGGNTQGWTSVDQDGDTHEWDFVDISNLASPVSTQGEVAISESYNNTNGVYFPDNYLISPAINLSSQSGTINVSFKLGSAENTTYFAEYVSVYVVTSTNIATINASTPIHSEALTLPSQMSTFNYDISSFAGQNNVRLVFRHHNCSDEFYLILDDINVSATGPNPVTDVAVLRAYSDDIVNVYDYSIIPNTQRAPLTAGAQLQNTGTTALTNRVLSIVINDGTSNVYSGTQSFNLAVGETKYVWKATNFTPVDNKNYTVTCSVVADGTNTNNSGTANFQTQTNVYAHDYPSTESVGFNLNDEARYINAFEIINTATLYAVDIEFANGTTPNTEVEVVVHEGLIGTVVASRMFTVPNSAIGTGNVTNIPLDLPVILDGGTNYLVEVKKYNSPQRLFIGASSIGGEDNAFFKYGGPFGANYINDPTKAGAIRMNFGVGCSDFTSTAFSNEAQSCLPTSGNIVVNASGSNAVANQFNYSWSGTLSGTSPANQSADYVIGGLIPGTYTVTVTNNGCSSTIEGLVVGVIQSPTVSASVTSQISCNGASDGAVSYSVVGDASDYTFSWNTGETATSLSNLEAGTYIVTGSNGVCVLNGSVNLADPALLDMSFIKTNVSSCGGTNGQIAITTAGGSGTNYTYAWTGTANGSSGPGLGTAFNIQNLSAGNYIITVSNGGCSNTETVSLSENGAPTITINEQTSITCPGAANGSLKVTSSSSILSYTFTWNNGITGVNNLNLSAGTYSVIGTNGTCTITQSYVLENPEEIAISGLTGISTIATTVTGGTGALNYAWSGPSNFTSNASNLSGLTNTGTYNLTVTDQNGCSNSESFILAFVGEEELIAENEVKVYPNPSTDLVNFELNNNSKSIIIFDYTGKQILASDITDNKVVVDVNLYSPGIYFFKIFDLNNKEIYSDKFQVVK